jgi:MFS family permease
MLFPFSMLSFVVSRYIVPAIYKRLSVLQTGILGMCLMLSGALLLLSAILLQYNMVLILLSIACVTGSGMSVCYPSLTALAIGDIPGNQQGLAAGIVTTAYFLGAGLGLSLISLGMQIFEPSHNLVTWPSIVMLCCFSLPGIIGLWRVRKRIF